MSVVKVYKQSNFDDLVKEVENIQLEGMELNSIKFDCHKDPTGKVMFWYAVVIFEKAKMQFQPPYWYQNPSDFPLGHQIVCSSSEDTQKVPNVPDNMTVEEYLKLMGKYKLND